MKEKRELLYDELKERLRIAEESIDAIRKGRIDLIIGEKGTLLLRLKELVEENERLARVFDSLPESIMIIDSNQNILSCNKATLGFFNATADDIIGKKCCEVVHKSKKMPDECPFRRMIISKRREQLEIQIGDRHYLITLDPEIDDKGELVSYMHNMTDITERRKIESQLKLLWKAVENVDISLMITNVSGDLVYVNPGFTRITGYDSEEVMGQNPRFLKSGKQDTEFYKNLWNKILSGKTWEGELINKRKNGELYWEKAIISPIADKDGKITHFVGAKEDITEKKKLSDELIKAKTKAEESSRLKSAFLANISHEIRTPLNGIIGFTELLQNINITKNERELYFDLLKESGQRLLYTINQIIEMSKIETGIEPILNDVINISELLSYQHKFFASEAFKKGLTFTLNLNNIANDFMIETDKYKLESIISNLVKNAIKFTHSGFVELGAEIEGEEIIFFVKDSGTGIPENRLNSIFHRFVQADISSNRPYEGLGLGLSIAKSYAEMLGGNITVESQVGKGSTFRLVIPCKEIVHKSEKKSDIPVVIQRGNNESRTILVAEDDDMNYFYVETILKKEGYKVLRAKTGNEAVYQTMKNPETSLILMDIKMPLMDGLTAAGKIREFNKTLPIIAQTAYAHDSDREEALKKGCTDYISKPFTVNSLLSKIKSLLQD
ncbi:MAG: PAS domain S-box protein [Bacteroidales bacterium]